MFPWKLVSTTIRGPKEVSVETSWHPTIHGPKEASVEHFGARVRLVMMQTQSWHPLYAPRSSRRRAMNRFASAGETSRRCRFFARPQCCHSGRVMTHIVDILEAWLDE